MIEGKARQKTMQENNCREKPFIIKTDDEIYDHILQRNQENPIPDAPEPVRRPDSMDRMRQVPGRIMKKLVRRVQWACGAFYIRETSGRKRKCHTVCRIESTTLSGPENKQYIIYADGTKDADGNVNLFVSAYHPKAPKGRRLIPIEDPDEKCRMEEIADDMKKAIRNELNGLPL